MPRKLNKLPESMSAANDNNKKHLENPATMPASNLEDTVKINLLPGGPRNKETLTKTLELNEKNNQLEELRGKRAEEDLRAQINESGSDRATSKDMGEARKAISLEKAKKDQDKVINKAAAFGLSQAQFLQMLDNGPLEENESKSFFGTITNTFRRLAGQPWAGKDAKKLNELMESYRAAEKTVDTANAEALENAPSNARPRYRVTDASQMSKGGDSLEEMKKSAADMVNPETYKMTGKVNAELAKLKEEETLPSTVDALLERYRIHNAENTPFSAEEIANDETLLSYAYNEIKKTNKKDAESLVKSIGKINLQANPSAFGKMKDKESLKYAAKPTNQSSTRNGISGGIAYSGRMGAGSMKSEVSDLLHQEDYKDTKKKGITLENQEVAAEKALYAKEVQNINAKADYLRLFSPRQAEEIYALLAGKKAGPSEKANMVANAANLYKSMAFELSSLDSQASSKLFEKDVDYDRKLKLEVAMDRVASYASKVTIEAKAGESEEIELTENDLEILDHKKPSSTRSKPPEIPTAKTKEVIDHAQKMNDAFLADFEEKENAEFVSDADIELIEDEAMSPVKASEEDIAAFAKAINKRSGKEKKSNKKQAKKTA